MLNNNEYLNKLYRSDQPLIIYKNSNGFDVYTDFSKKYLINKKNIKNFLNIQTKKKKSNSNSLNCYVGFFGYKLLCENIGIKFPKQKTNNFYNGIFYQPLTKVRIRKNISIQSLKNNFRNIKIDNKKYSVLNKKFDLNLSLQQYSKLFDDFSTRIKLHK